MRGVKWLGLLISVIIVNIILLSPGLIGLGLGNSNVESAVVVTIWIVSAIVVIVGSYSFLFRNREQQKILIREHQAGDDYREYFLRYRNHKVLHHEVNTALGQFVRMRKRKEALERVLQDRFDPTEMSYQRFGAVIVGVEQLFQQNMKGMFNKLQAFEASDISQYANQPKSSIFSNKLHQQKAELFHQYMQTIQGYVNASEEILFKMDQLLLEISRLGSGDYRDIEEMACMKDIDALIKQTKFYQ